MLSLLPLLFLLVYWLDAGDITFVRRRYSNGCFLAASRFYAPGRLQMAQTLARPCRRACETAMPSRPSLRVPRKPPKTGKSSICGGVVVHLRCVGRRGEGTGRDRRRDSQFGPGGRPSLSLCLFLPLTQAAGNPSPSSFVPPAYRFLVAFAYAGAVLGTSTVRYLRDTALQPSARNVQPGVDCRRHRTGHPITTAALQSAVCNDQP